MKKFLLFVFTTILLPQFAMGEDYPIVFDKDKGYSRSDRHLDGVVFDAAISGRQSLSIATPRKVYTFIENPTFNAMAGETVNAQFLYTGNWMNGFVYIDRGQDGNFDVVQNADGTVSAGSDAVAFSYAEPSAGSGVGYNSKGERVNNANVLNPPAFTVPEDLAPGFYMMRYKVDWASIDPAGRPEDGNGILKNGGAICDVRLNVHAAEGNLAVDAENGTLLAADGAALPAKVPFGKPIELKVVPAEGYVLDFISVRHGHNLGGEQYKHSVQQFAVDMYPGYYVKDGVLVVPASYVDGDVELTAVFVKAGGGEGGDGYALSFDKDVEASNTFNRIAVNDVVFDIDGDKAYYDFTSSPVIMYNAKNLSLVFEAATGKDNYMYIDLNNDGRFTAVVGEDGSVALSSELVAYKGDKLYFQFPEELSDGIYRARVKVDADNISSNGSQNIVAEGGYIADFLINLVSGEKSLAQHTVDGCIDGDGYTALPLKVTPGTGFTAVMRGAPGFECGELVVRHGHNLGGEQLVNGNIQWREDAVAVVDGKAVVDAALVDGDVVLFAEFIPQEGSEWQLVFSDEFNAADYLQPLDEKWMRCQRYSATWNRWLSDSKEVIYLQGGDLVARAIPNPDTVSDPVPMITGGIKSNNRFGFTYGYVEARILSNAWRGHFPAFWMMPEDQSAGWPDCGEIDIWEAIDTDGRSYHTIHSNWSYDLGQKNNPRSSFNTGVPYDRYHTYGLRWSENMLVWYVDGKEVGRYAKSSDTSALNQGQWPFDKHFHLILNQSVGNGSWAANADVEHTYETRFDWVRVYQEKGMENTNGTVGIVSVAGSGKPVVAAVAGGVNIEAFSPVKVEIFDIAGRRVASLLVEGSVDIPLQSGVYVVAGQKVFVK